MNGGLYCDSNGQISKPFPDKDYCKDGSGNIGVKNNADGVVSFCQTVLPGNEAMLIPTSIQDWEALAVPGPSYWCETAAHYYINPPGVGTDKACVWGSKDNPVGNWSPYVAGANTDPNGNTFIKLAWNPVYLEPATPFRNNMPTWGVEISCEGDGCNGLPCKIDPKENSVNQMVGQSTDGAGGGAFCVVTVPKGVKADFVVFQNGGGMDNSGGSNHHGSSAAPPPPPPSSSSPPSSSPPPPPPPPSSSSAPPPSSTYQPPPPPPSSENPPYPSSVWSAPSVPVPAPSLMPGNFVDLNATSSSVAAGTGGFGSGSGASGTLAPTSTFVSPIPSPAQQTTNGAGMLKVTPSNVLGMGLLVIGAVYVLCG
ncbi:MAG: hypothetical protein Q9160_009312 [Pyrenula sp. 1 TL-2023]